MTRWLPRGRRLQDAPYVLEAFADEFGSEEPPVKLVRASSAAPGRI